MYQIGSELSVQEQFYEHVSAYVGNGLVFHNHPVRGEELISLNVFAKGRKINVKKQGVDDITAFLTRVNYAISNPSSYQWRTYNCDHTVSRLRTGIAKSPQVWFWSVVVLLTVAGTIPVLRSR